MSRAGNWVVVVILALAGVGLSVGLNVVGFPNYTLGMFIAVIASYYFFGFFPAAIAYVISVAGLTFLGYPHIGIAHTAGWMGLAAATVAILFIGYLLRSIQRAHEEEIKLHKELLKSHQDLSSRYVLERHVGDTLQKAFVPDLPKKLDHCAVAAIYEAGMAEAEVGGDFYDVFLLPDNAVGVVIGDVSGKGIEATGDAVAAKYALHFCLYQGGKPSYCLGKLNDLLTHEPSLEGFITIFCGILEPAANKMTYCTGGHEPPILQKAEGEATKILIPNGPAVGIGKDGYADAVVDFEPCDRMLLFTDGLSEARQGKELLGVEGLRDILRSEQASDPEQALRDIFKKVKDYSGGKLKDDAAAVLIVTLPPEKPEIEQCAER